MTEASRPDQRILTLIHINSIIRAILEAYEPREKPAFNIHSITDDSAWQGISGCLDTTKEGPRGLLRGSFHVHIVSFFWPSSHRRARPSKGPGRDCAAAEQHKAASTRPRNTDEKVFRCILRQRSRQSERNDTVTRCGGGSWLGGCGIGLQRNDHGVAATAHRSSVPRQRPTPDRDCAGQSNAKEDPDCLVLGQSRVFQP